MFFKILITSIFIVIVFHFTVINTRYLWDKPKINQYDKSYKEILNIIKSNTNESSANETNATNSSTNEININESTDNENMEKELKNFIENLT